MTREAGVADGAGEQCTGLAPFALPSTLTTLPVSLPGPHDASPPQSPPLQERGCAPLPAFSSSCPLSPPPSGPGPPLYADTTSDRVAQNKHGGGPFPAKRRLGAEGSEANPPAAHSRPRAELGETMPATQGSFKKNVFKNSPSPSLFI